MKLCHKLTEEESNELYRISRLLKSSDEESVALGVGLLENYPKSAQAPYYLWKGILEEKYTPRLDYLISMYNSHKNKYNLSIFLPSVVDSLGSDPNWVIEFVVNALITQCYYYEDE